METESADVSSEVPAKDPNLDPLPKPKVSNFPQPTRPGTGNSQAGSFSGMSSFARFTNGLGGMRFPSLGSPEEEKKKKKEEEEEGNSNGQGLMESLAKGFADSSRSAVRAMQVKARHVVSQNKRRYQEGGFDLDMTYITDNIIAMGFPAGDLSSGLFGFFEGFYRNHMDEVINFFETHHKGKYKVYNLCSERLYDASKFEGKVACFPFDDHNCPPLQLITSFCQSAHSWLKEDIQNVVVVHCKAGMGRTGLMICSLLLFLKFFPTAEEAIDYFNQKRCVDGKALVLPSQIRYVNYFEHVLTLFNGENQPGRRCMLRGFRLHGCPYWIRPSITISDHNGVLFSTRKHPKTKNLMPEDFWIRAPRKNVLVFALPGQPGVTELVGDFKIHFQDRQGDFYCWLNTTMTENRKILDASELDGFDKRKLPSPGFQLEIVMIDYDGTSPMHSKAYPTSKASDASSTGNDPGPRGRAAANSHQKKASENDDDVFSDGEEDTEASKSRQGQAAPSSHSSNTLGEQARAISHATEQLSLRSQEPSDRNVSKESTTDAVPIAASGLETHNLDSMGASDIKAMAADASVFTFGDEEDYESD